VKIVDVVTTPVTVPTDAPLRWSQGVEDCTTRTIVEVKTDDGITGIGEMSGGARSAAEVESCRDFLIGLDPAETGPIHRRLALMELLDAYTAVELACLDAVGKATGRTVASLLGGAIRDRISVASYLFYRYPSADGRLAAVDGPERMLERAVELTDRNGHRRHKLKGGVFPPAQEYRALQLLRETFPDAPLVWDPNAAWSVETTIRVGQRLLSDGFELEFLEDPTWGVEGMRQARAALGIPFATNDVANATRELAPAITQRAVDVILADIGWWGGFRGNLKMAAVAEAFGVGVAMHSDMELGVSTAAMVHLACVMPNLNYAIDSHYHDQADDVIAEPWVYRDGCFVLPERPGLGVELDRDKLDFYHRYWEEHGELQPFFDPYRPDWDPTLPLF
jgi:glucarate dehydratase